MDADAYEANIVEAYEAMLRKKDAEIERLKVQVKELSEAYQKAIGPIEPASQKALINELADALYEALAPYNLDRHNKDLIQRAREATNGNP
jgi:hypothetical protein